MIRTTSSATKARLRKLSGRYVTSALIMFWPVLAFGLNFTPTETEWNTWSPECRARYVISGAGRISWFANRVSTSEVERFASMYGKGWNHMHHYCAARVRFNRAKVEKHQRHQTFLYESVISISEYSRVRTPVTERLYSDILILQAQAHEQLGEKVKAFEFVEKAREFHPTYGSPYAMLALMLKREGRLTEARDVLTTGLEKVVSGEPELHYFLGLVYLDFEEYELAKFHAEQAAVGGYPLIGLQRALARREAQSSR